MKVMQTEPLKKSVQYLKGVGPRRARLLGRLGITTVEDLLHYFPRRYEQISPILPITKLVVNSDKIQRVRGRVVHITDQRPRNGLHITKAVIQDDTGILLAVWFNQPYIKQRLAAGSRVTLSGKVQLRYGQVQMTNPTYERDHEINGNRLDVGDREAWLPLYPTTDGISQHLLRSLVRQALRIAGEHVAQEESEFLPWSVISKHRLLPRPDALQQIHFPSDKELYLQARRRLAFEELFLLQLTMGLLRESFSAQTRGIEHFPPDGAVEEFYQRLPYSPTRAQRRVVQEILTDMAAPRPMQRLLQGDVGAGKTMVAAAALWNAVRSGYQGLLMAPTEILAGQHYRSLQTMLAPWGIRVELLTGGLKPSERNRILAAVATGDTDVLVGTHALLQEDVTLPRLSLAITDEQHRFGVRQRSRLAAKGSAPDVLVMTATPIPRTLALAFYGDLDISVLDELPPGRQPVKTRWLPPSQRARVYNFVRQQLERGRQGYVVCPVIEQTADHGLKAAVEWHRRLALAFPNLNVVLLHGRMPAVEKARIMDSFRAGEINLLVATSVIEVGVDVPNATLMVIEDADRFGLAQLHQLRGRVGRGRHQSYCFLIAEPSTPEAERRLRVMEQTHDGFQLAEHDLALRGPGEFLGTRQHGLPELRIADLGRDLRLLELAREEARLILAMDPQLRRADHRLLKLAVGRFYRQRVSDGEPMNLEMLSGIRSKR